MMTSKYVACTLDFSAFFGNGRKTSATIIWPSHNLWKILGKRSGSSRESSKIFCDHPHVKALHRKTHIPSFYYKTTALSKHNLKQTQVTLSLWELNLSGNETLIETSDCFTPGGRWEGGCLSEILKRSPKRYQDPVMWAWLEIFSTAKWYQF